MEILNKDVSQLIYNYCNISDLQSLQNTCKKNYEYANYDYYKRRVELFLGINEKELIQIILLINEMVDNNNEIDESDRARIHYYDRKMRYEAIKKLFRYPYLIFNLEKKSQYVFAISEKLLEYISLKKEDNDNGNKKAQRILIRKMRDGIRCHYFRRQIYKNNIKQFPKSHINVLSSNCKLVYGKDRGYTISDNPKLHLFDYIHSFKGDYCVLEKDNKLELVKLSGFFYPAMYYRCLEMFEIRDYYELGLLYNFTFCKIEIAGLNFIRGEVVDGQYKAYFETKRVPGQKIQVKHYTGEELINHERLAKL